MSQAHRRSPREQNGSLTSEDDSMNDSVLSSIPGSSEHQQSSRMAQRDTEKGPDTSTPVKATLNQQQRVPGLVGPGPQSVGVHRDLIDELEEIQAAESSISAVRFVNLAMAVNTSSPVVSSVQHSRITSTFSSSTSASPSASTSASPDTPKRSFVSEYKSGTIQAQRHELQLLMSDLKSRDMELNDTVKAHHQELLGWEKDRQRILTLEQRNTMAESEAKIQNEHVRALIARLKTMESVQQTKQGALDTSQEHLATLTEQLTQNQLKLKESQDKNRQTSLMVKNLSKTLGKLEAKEQEMLCLLKLKDQDLTTASAHLSELNSKIKLLDDKVKQGERAEAEGHKTTTEWQQKHFELKRITDKLKSDLNHSQQEEEDSRTEIECNKLERERLRKQILNMADREKRQEEIIHSQRLKQERIDAELASVRQLYERQQRNMAVLYLNLDTARDAISKHRDCCTDSANVSLLLQSPTLGKTVTYYKGETTVTVPAGSRLDSSQSASMALHSDRRIQGLLSALDTDLQSAVGPGHHRHTDTVRNNSSSSASYSQTSAEVEKPKVQASGQKQPDQPQQKEQQRAAQSFIPVMVQGAPGSVAQSDSSEAQRLAGTPRPASAIPQYSGRSQEKNTTGSAHVHATLSSSSDGYGSGQVTLEKRYYQRETQSEQDEDEVRVVQRVKTRRVSYTEDVADRAAGSSTPPPPPPRPNLTSANTTSAHTTAHNATSPAGAAGLEHSVHADYPEQTGLSVAAVEDDVVRLQLKVHDTSTGWTDGSVSASSDNELHSDNNLPESPTSKMHGLLTKSQQMMQKLERSTFPPFFPQEPLSPIKPEAEGEDEE